MSILRFALVCPGPIAIQESPARCEGIGTDTILLDPCTSLRITGFVLSEVLFDIWPAVEHQSILRSSFEFLISPDTRYARLYTLFRV